MGGEARNYWRCLDGRESVYEIVDVLHFRLAPHGSLVEPPSPEPSSDQEDTGWHASPSAARRVPVILLGSFRFERAYHDIRPEGAGFCR